jgi:predicted nucleic acid-binding Zn ribbon protein
VLARVQGCWPSVVGPAIAEHAWPLGERDGTLTVGCRSATWANELDLLGPELLGRLNTALGGDAEAPLRDLRAKVANRH